jgi:hypothetical protein
MKMKLALLLVALIGVAGIYVNTIGTSTPLIGTWQQVTSVPCIIPCPELGADVGETTHNLATVDVHTLPHYLEFYSDGQFAMKIGPGAGASGRYTRVGANRIEFTGPGGQATYQITLSRGALVLRNDRHVYKYTQSSLPANSL